MRLSVVIPIHNSADFIRTSLETLDSFLGGQMDSYEIIAVDDGSTDRTAELIEALQSKHVRLVRRGENGGKFAAIKSGMAAAQGSCRIFTDADLPYDLSSLVYIEQIVNRRGFHLVVGDRTLAGSRCSIAIPFFRRLITGICRTAIRLLVTGGVFDTQCGLKGFRADVAEAIFPLLRDDGFSGDVELMYLALKYNLEIKRIAVRLVRSAPSTVKIGRDPLRMLRRVAMLWWAWRRGMYFSPKLRQLGEEYQCPLG